jgi:hypothetical protein
LGLFGKTRKCYSCGGDYDLKTCTCGKHYCSVHGFGDKCSECQASSIGTLVQPWGEVRTEVAATEPQQEGKPGGELIPRMIRGSFDHSLSETESVRENLLLDMNRYRRIFLNAIKVKSNH